MLIKQNENGKGVLVVLGEDRVGRADARLVSLLMRITRELKSRQESLYHCEDSYKQDKPVMLFDWEDREKVFRVVRMNSFDCKIEA